MSRHVVVVVVVLLMCACTGWRSMFRFLLEDHQRQVGLRLGCLPAGVSARSRRGRLMALAAWGALLLWNLVGGFFGTPGSGACHRTREFLAEPSCAVLDILKWQLGRIPAQL